MERHAYATGYEAIKRPSQAYTESAATPTPSHGHVSLSHTHSVMIFWPEIALLISSDLKTQKAVKKVVQTDFGFVSQSLTR